LDALVHHAVLGEVWPKAVDYLRQAGAAAFARGSVAESLARYEQALAFAGRLDTSRENLERAIDVRLDLHVPLVVLGRSRGSSRSTRNRSGWPATSAIPHASPGSSIA
jgi:hypothetical protein